ncbi:MAG: hypothetical protein AUK31_01700 [Fibrobacteres bacterium CG2_30_45_31]|nr:MAG: hypothetical protein AUK31_01700 [Fibrobacteres bacterium CG2_30_45_31]
MSAAERLKALNKKVPSRSGSTYEFLHVLFSIENPKEKWVSNRMPPMSISYALAELIWILSGSDIAEIVNYWNPNLYKYSGNDVHYHGAYGHRIRHNFGMDQLEKAFNILHNKPESRQMVILIWDPEKDLPKDTGVPNSADIPCNICSLLKVREHRLEWTQIMRSNDAFRGLPYNFVQFTSMQEILAGWLGLEVGTYAHYSDSLHLYENDFDNMKIYSNKFSKNTDSLSVSKCYFDSVVEKIYKRMKRIVTEDPDETHLETISSLDSESQAYNNIMLIISAYVARKKEYLRLKEDILSRCTNPLYLEIWNRWDAFYKKGAKTL